MSSLPDLDAAIEFAAKAHKGQVRDGQNPLPYITHPIDVLINLRYVGGVVDPDMLCAAALHDVVEECDVPFEEIEKRFGKRVRELVQELTRREPTAEETAGMDKDQIWELRANMLLAEIEKMSPEAQTVKLADRFSNITEAKRVKWGKKLERYSKQTTKILKIVPRKVNPGLWDAVKEVNDSVKG
jgi:(p)ppGpp synthase/HD superfamily hydrolase